MKDNKNNPNKGVKVVNPQEVKELLKMKPHELSKDILSITGHTFTYNGSIYGEIIKHF
jgi:hypothetical protein